MKYIYLSNPSIILCMTGNFVFPFSKFCNKSVNILYCFIIEYHNPRMLHSKLCCNLSSGIFLFDILLKKGVVLHMPYWRMLFAKFCWFWGTFFKRIKWKERSSWTIYFLSPLLRRILPSVWMSVRENPHLPMSFWRIFFSKIVLIFALCVFIIIVSPNLEKAWFFIWVWLRMDKRKMKM